MFYDDLIKENGIYIILIKIQTCVKVMNDE